MICTNSMFLLILNGILMEMDGLGVDWVSGTIPIEQKALTLTETGSILVLVFLVRWRQTGPPRMTAMTLGSYQVVGGKVIYLGIYRSNLGFGFFFPIFVFLRNKLIS